MVQTRYYCGGNEIFFIFEKIFLSLIRKWICFSAGAVCVLWSQPCRNNISRINIIAIRQSIKFRQSWIWTIEYGCSLAGGYVIVTSKEQRILGSTHSVSLLCLGFQCTERAAEGVWVAYAYRISWSLFLFSPAWIYSHIFPFFFPSLFDTFCFSPFVFKRTCIPSERPLKHLRPSVRLYACKTEHYRVLCFCQVSTVLTTVHVDITAFMREWAVTYLSCACAERWYPCWRGSCDTVDTVI